MKESALRKEDRQVVPSNQVLFTEEQAARMLQLTSKALQAWRYRGVGPLHIRISRRCIRYRREDLLAFIEARVRSSTSDRNPEEV